MKVATFNKPYQIESLEALMEARLTESNGSIEYCLEPHWLWLNEIYFSAMRMIHGVVCRSVSLNLMAWTYFVNLISRKFVRGGILIRNIY